MADELPVIPAKFRAALLAKGILLVSLAAFFTLLGVGAWTLGHWPLTARVGVAALTVMLALYLGWAASLALLDLVLGQAMRSTGATPLEQRRTGYSLKLPSGRNIEYILYNTWPPLQPGVTYTVLYGRRSGVLVAPPEPEDTTK